MRCINVMSIFRSKSFRYGVPFFTLIIGGSFALREFTELRYTYQLRHTYFDAVKKGGLEIKKPGEVTLEAEYEKLQKMDLDNWENVRVPRPWDESLDTK